MSARRLPVRPDLDQLKHQAKDLLKAYRDGDAEASARFRRTPSGHTPAPVAPNSPTRSWCSRASTVPPAGRASSSAASSSTPSGTTTRTRCAGW